MSLIGMAASLLREGKTPEHVARTVRMPLAEVESIAREVAARKAKEGAASKPRKPHLHTDRSEAIRRDIASMPKVCRQVAMSDEAKAKIRELYHTHTNEAIAEIIGSNPSTVAGFANRHGLRKPPGFRAKPKAEGHVRHPRNWVNRDDLWSDEQLSALEEMSGSHTYDEIGEVVGKTAHAVASMANKRRLMKPTGFKSPTFRCLLKASYYLRRGDHITALHVIEKAIKDGHRAGKSG